jgi:dihydropyrimidine dehydrogenase (NAD+) subunit PreT
MSEAKHPDVQAGRLSPAQLAQNFCDAHPPLNAIQANIEAERCYYCFDAPCQTACPTGIDIPTFIRRIADGNLRGAAGAILEENPLGGMCARVCPTEVLCEQACVRNTNEHKPVEIGLLQRHATDAYFQQPGAPLFVRAADTGRRVAVVGAGPAGLACAHRLALLGHQVALFDAAPKLGGLNEYGLATYQPVGDFAQREIDWLLSIGGISVHCSQALGRDFTLAQLSHDFDAVFLGLGLAGVNELGLAEPALPGLRPAVDFIAELRQSRDYGALPVPRRVLVIGGGMTAVDAAVQSRKLGAEEVTMVYRRGPDAMGASAYEQSWARDNGVRILHWAAPRALLSSAGAVSGMEFASTALEGSRLIETGERFALPADAVLSAIGQSFVATVLEDSGVALQGGRIATDAEGRSSLPKVWAGGDARFGGRDLTVEAVQHGKLAAASIHQTLAG